MLKRGLFLHHYMPAMMFAMMVLAYQLDRVSFPGARSVQTKTAFLVGIIGVFVWCSVFFAPLTYGLPLDTNQEMNRRKWLPTWPLAIGDRLRLLPMDLLESMQAKLPTGTLEQLGKA